MTKTAETLLTVRDLSIAFGSAGHEVLAVDKVSFDIGRGETLALVGEFGLGQVGHRAERDETAALSGGASPFRLHQVQEPRSPDHEGEPDPQGAR